jgi:hypothetical protein
MYGKVNEGPIMKQVFGGKKKMAKKSRKIVKVDDVQRTLAIRSPSTSVSAMTVQVPDMLMRANRRQYQQARCYDLQVQIAETQSTTAKTYEIYTLSNAWWVKKSIEFAKAVYMNATNAERKLLGNRRAKWNDFIIFAGESGTIANYSDLFQFSPATSGDDMTAAEVTSDETLYEAQTKASEVEGDQDLGAEIEYGFSLEATDVTGSVRSYNIFDQYMLTRQHVTPADTRDSPYQDLLDLDQSAMDNLKADGDNAPFDLDAFPSPWVLADSISADNGPPQGRFISKMISAPLGIVVIKKLTSGSTEANWASTETMLITCKKGTYKGVHAPAYKATKLLTK